ncbi:hypothetical protein A2U01_0093381, partial [Trifolium medium]|nr:hypothetical protein [Trifolium medium]
HAKLFDGQTQLVVSEPEKEILEDMGVESIKNEIANSSMDVMKLLEIVSFLNGRECQNLAERDAARKKLEGVGLKYNELKA